MATKQIPPDARCALCGRPAPYLTHFAIRDPYRKIAFFCDKCAWIISRMVPVYKLNPRKEVDEQ